MHYTCSKYARKVVKIFVNIHKYAIIEKYVQICIVKLYYFKQIQSGQQIK